MSSEQVDSLKDRILGGKKKSTRNVLTDIADMMRSFGSIGDLLGREFIIYDENGKVKYTMKQKPILLGQMNLLMQELAKLKEEDLRNKADFWSRMLGGKKGRR